jgi:predicted nucleic-acid-binding protein
MSIAIDTNVLVRLLVRDDESQYAAALRAVEEAAAADQPVLIVLGALLETEWVLRNRYKLDKASIAGAMTALLESEDVEFEHLPNGRRGVVRLGPAPGRGLR